MNILIIGSGGREHALAHKISQSSQCRKLYCVPGNAGIADVAECAETDDYVGFCQDHAIDLVVVGPEQPLVDGVSDDLRAAGISVFGCSKAAAVLEGSKGFMKDLCKKYNIPTAQYDRFTDLNKAKAFITAMTPPIVIKTDGLAAGKGVIIAQTHDEATEVATRMLSGDMFGASGTEIVVEAFLEGEELSFFALSDGKTVLPLTSAQDHKTVGDGDTGPNTGGMGAYSPAHMMTDALQDEIVSTIIQPTIDGMAAEGKPFIGVLFAGIMLVNGKPFLIEHNIRFGDPECQAIMPRLKSDVVTILHACATQTLDQAERLVWSDETALCVVMATQGYPGSYPKYTPIGLPEKTDDAIIFHAGTAIKDGNLVSTGGRVLGVTSTGATVSEAQQKAYQCVDTIQWPNGFCRRDIGYHAVSAMQDTAA